MKRILLCCMDALAMLTIYSCGNQDNATDKGTKMDTTGNQHNDTLNRPLPMAPIDSSSKKTGKDSSP